MSECCRWRGISRAANVIDRKVMLLHITVCLNLDLGFGCGLLSEGSVPAYCWPGCCWETQGDEV